MTVAERPVDADQHADAVGLIRELCVVAGDDGVLDVLGRYAARVGVDQARRDCAAALYVVFAECMSRPVPPGTVRLVAVPIPDLECAR